MIVCECFGLTDKDIQKKLEAGASKLTDLIPACGLKESCGSCLNLFREVIQHYRNSAQLSSSRESKDFSGLGTGHTL